MCQDSELLPRSSGGVGGWLGAALLEFQGHRGDSESLSGSSGGGHGAPPKPLSEACSQTCGETVRVCLHTSSGAPCCEHCVWLVTNKSVESWPVVLQLRRVCGHHVMPQGHGHAQQGPQVTAACGPGVRRGAGSGHKPRHKCLQQPRMRTDGALRNDKNKGVFGP